MFISDFSAMPGICLKSWAVFHLKVEWHRQVYIVQLGCHAQYRKPDYKNSQAVK